MARLSRPESQARTREQVLSAARGLYLRDGFAVTTIERVAEEAGYSKGAVYSNFATKNLLCLAVLDRIRTEQAEALAAEVGRASELPDRIEAFRRWAERHIGDPSWTGLEVEFSITNRHDDAITAEITGRRRAIVTTIAELLVAQAEAAGVELAGPPESAALALLSMGIGIGVQRALDPTVPVEPLVAHLAALLTR